MRIHHIAIWTFRLEEMKKFYIRYFKGTSNVNTSHRHLDFPSGRNEKILYPLLQRYKQ